MAIFDELKSIGKVLQEAGKIELYTQILEIQEKLLEMQNNISELDKDNKELQEKLKNKEILIFEKNSYWINKEGGKEGPYCTCCWDDINKTIRMQPDGNPAYFSCPKCENNGVEIYPEKNLLNKQFNNRNTFNDYGL